MHNWLFYEISKYLEGFDSLVQINLNPQQDESAKINRICIMARNEISSGDNAAEEYTRYVLRRLEEEAIEYTDEIRVKYIEPVIVDL